MIQPQQDAFDEKMRSGWWAMISAKSITHLRLPGNCLNICLTRSEFIGCGLTIKELTTTRQLNADDAIFAVVSTSNLISWSAGNVVLRSTTLASAGQVTEVWRITEPAAGDVLFLRCRTTLCERESTYPWWKQS